MDASRQARRLMLHCLAACLLVSPLATLAAEPVVTLRAGSSSTATDPLTLSLNKLSELVASKTNGEVAIRVFPQSLGVEHQLVQGAQTGGVDIGMISNGNASRFTSAYLVLDLPFLFKRYEDLLDFMGTPTGHAMIGQFEKDTGLKSLYLVSFGSGRDIQTRNKALRTPSDIKGLKIRTISTPVELATFKAWGANPTPLDWDQTYGALQQGVIDGMQSNIGPVWAGKFYEVVKHDLRINYTASFVDVFMSASKFASLAPQYQKAILDSAVETQAWIRKYAADQLQSYLDDLKAKGVEVYTPTPAEYQEWIAVRDSVWKEAAKSYAGKIDLGLAERIYSGKQ
jgi:tripartite ATP-independent transporter DctP family solute receptor